MKPLSIDLSETLPYKRALIRGLEQGLDINYALCELINFISEAQARTICQQWYFDDETPCFVEVNK